MTVVDVSAFTGAWPSHPVNGRLDQVVESLKKVGVDRVMCSPLDAVWCRNPHLYNASLYLACEERPELLAVPIMDPTVDTWLSELDEAVSADAQAIRVLPNYHQFDVSGMTPFWDAVSESGLVTIIQTRMEDPRRQHPLSVVEDVFVGDILALADRRVDIRFILGGARSGEIRAAAPALLERPNLFADVSQADGLDAVKLLVDEGLVEKLLVGSHSPLFIPEAAVARVVTDLGDEEVKLVLGGNAGKLFRVK